MLDQAPALPEGLTARTCMSILVPSVVGPCVRPVPVPSLIIVLHEPLFVRYLDSYRETLGTEVQLKASVVVVTVP